MTGFEIFLIILLVWFAVGFISGTKMIYWDKILSKENIALFDDEFSDYEMELIEVMRERKSIPIVVFTILGGLSFMIDTINTFQGGI